MKVGYIRVSTEEQNLARQLEDLKPYNIEKIFEEKKSGKNTTERVVFNEMMSFLREGDELYVVDFSRLSRSVRDLLDIVDKLKDKNVKLVSLKENVDTSNTMGKFFLTIIAFMNELERENMLERQREGIAVAKTEGKYRGRKPLQLDNFDVVYSKWKSGKITAVKAAKILGITRATFYKRVKALSNSESTLSEEVDQNGMSSDEDVEEGGHE